MIRIPFNVQLAFREIFANKIRSFLTMLGVIIGIASVSAILSLGAGAESLMTNALKNLGTDTLSVFPGQSNENGPPAQVLGIQVDTLVEEDRQVIMDMPHVLAVTAYSNGNAEMTAGRKRYSGRYSGVHASYPQVESHAVSRGRFFTELEVRSMKNFIVLGDEVAQELFPVENPVGRYVMVNKEKLLVIGVLEKRGSTLFESYDNRVFVPISLAQKKLNGKNYYDSLRLKLENESYVESMKKRVTQILMYNHGFEKEEDIDFSVRSIAQALSVFTGVTGALRLFLAFIASISLLVGGISITNIMLMNVKERTKEIGLKKAIGAKPKMIMNQFLIETVVLTSLGAFLGLVVGVLFSAFVAILMNILDYAWSFSVNIFALILTMIFAMFLGLIFGVYPAKQAANLHPINALRTE